MYDVAFTNRFISLKTAPLLPNTIPVLSRRQKGISCLPRQLRNSSTTPQSSPPPSSESDDDDRNSPAASLTPSTNSKVNMMHNSSGGNKNRRKRENENYGDGSSLIPNNTCDDFQGSATAQHQTAPHRQRMIGKAENVAHVILIPPVTSIKSSFNCM